VDYSGTPADVHRKLAERMRDTPVPAPAEAEDTSGKRGPGRPKLGVVGHEVTLLPRHWDWLNSQPGGASVSLRKLVDRARKANQGTDRIRRAQEAVYRFMVAVGGNLAGFEEAARALFAGDSDRFNECIAGWPVDVRDYSLQLAAGAFAEACEQAT
jgi:hypothetical protein